MAQIPTGRWTADVDGDFVVFLIGFRVSASWRALRAVPLLASMPKMLADLSADPSHGMLGYQNSAMFGTIVQYWRSFEALEHFARDSDARHARVWREWFRRAQHLNPAVGIWHETYRVAAHGYEAVYQGMPTDFGLMGAGSPRPVGVDVRAAVRLGVAESDVRAPTLADPHD